MRVKLIGLIALAAAGFAQATNRTDALDLWRQVRTNLTTSSDFFAQIKDCLTPRFYGQVVSQPGPNELIVNVDDSAGDAELRLTRGVKAQLSAGASIHFEGVVRSFTANPYRLKLEVWPEHFEADQGPPK